MELFIFDSIDSIFDFDEEYKKLPKSRKKKVDSLLDIKEKHDSIFEYHFIAKKLKLKEGQDFEYTQNGRPFVNGKMDFSISNSSVLCIAFFQNGLGGVDAEFVHEYKPDFAKMICNDDEIKMLEYSKNKNKDFTILFTKKEATLKLLDKNINNDLKNIIGNYKYTTREKTVDGKTLIVSTCEMPKN